MDSKKETETVPEEFHLLNQTGRQDSWVHLYKSFKESQMRAPTPMRRCTLASVKDFSLDVPSTRSVWTVML